MKFPYSYSALTAAMTLALALVNCSPDAGPAPTPTADSIINCSGQYWAQSNGNLVGLKIDAASDGTFSGTMTDYAGSISSVSGTCTPTHPDQKAAFSFTRTWSGTNSTQQYAGEFVMDLASRQLSMKGAFSENGNSYPFSALTNLDDAAVKIQDAAAIEAKRAQLIRFIWKNEGFPSSRFPTTVSLGVASPVAGLEASAARVDRYDIQMEDGYSSAAFHFHPLVSRHRLMIFHHGHTSALDSDGGKESIQYFLEQGYDVLAFYMLNYGPNTEPLSDHDKIIGMDSSAKPYNPMKLFLEPVAVGLNYAIQNDHFDLIAMMGISGGGWTTTLYSALDPRIMFSFPVAGSLPLYLRADARDVGDAEQYYPDFYRMAGYPDLYVLGASGVGRKQVQILNEFDGCCFARGTRLEYVSRVQSAVSQIGQGGAFDFQIDLGQQSHTISSWTIESVIFPTLEP